MDDETSAEAPRPTFLTIDQAVDRLRNVHGMSWVTPSTIAKLRRDGLPSKRVGKRIVLRQDQLDAFLEDTECRDTSSHQDFDATRSPVSGRSSSTTPLPAGNDSGQRAREIVEKLKRSSRAG